MEDKDEQIETLLDDVMRKQKDLLERWFKCFCSGGYDEQRRMAKQEIKNTLHSIQLSERFRDPETNFIKKLLLTNMSGGYQFDGGPILAQCFLGSMKLLSHWKEFTETLEDDLIDELLDKIKQRDETLLVAWFKCFEGSESEQRMKAKLEIKKTLIDSRNQRDPEISFIMRLMSDRPNGYTDSRGVCKRRENLAKLFMFTMKENRYWNEMLDATVVSSLSHNIEGAPIISRATWNRMNIEQIEQKYAMPRNAPTLLHEAARLEDVETVKYLIEAGIPTTRDMFGCSALHYAAMAIHPNAEIARMIVKVCKENSMLNAVAYKSSEEFIAITGGNTALHIAASNVNVTQEFIDEFNDANAVVFNDEHLSPFHVAAMSKNQKAIFYMLKTFAPTNNFWDVDEVDEKLLRNLDRPRPENTLINICARKGNAEAVALLIQNGADISLGVLHEIVLQSVKSPRKTDKLLEVYQSIVDNAVTWRCLAGNLVSPLTGSHFYRKVLSSTMIGLLTNRLQAYNNEDVLEYAISLGASAMFQQIVNTKNVFRFEFDNWQQSGDFCCGRFALKPGCSCVLFDVTHFMKATQPEMYAKETKSDKSTAEESTAILSQQLATRQAPEENAEHDSKYIKPPAPDFTKRRKPDMTYLSYMLSCSSEWKNSNILSTAPLKQLTKPYFALIQRFYLFVGLMQLVFMVLFSVYYTPDTCSLSLMFKVNITRCNDIASSHNSSELSMDANGNTSSTIDIQQGSSPTWFWLIWPIILIASSAVGSHYSVKFGILMKFGILNRRNALFAFRFTFLARELCKVILQSVSLRIFCCMMFVWFYKYRNSETRESYTEVTAMVLLFGWMVNLEFFGAINKNFSISALVIKEIIAKDIPSFMLFFAFTVVGFSFAIHALRMSTCELNHIDFRDTFYGVLSSAFGIGDFFENTISDRSCIDSAGTKHLFEVVYFTYIGVALIILLNILIAMMNNRYELSKQRAENIWRFGLLSAMCAIDDHKIFIKVFEEHQLLDLFRPGTNGCLRLLCSLGCCFHDKYNGILMYVESEKKHFLMFMLKPDDRREL